MDAIVELIIKAISFLARLLGIDRLLRKLLVKTKKWNTTSWGKTYISEIRENFKNAEIPGWISLLVNHTYVPQSLSLKTNTENIPTNWDIVSKTEGNFILYAGPGMGKTMNFRYLVLQVAKNEMFPGLVPFFIDISSFKHDFTAVNRSLEDFIAKRIIGTLKINGTDWLFEPHDLVRRILEKGRALILIDGIDKILPKRGTENEYLDEIKSFVQENSKCKYIISSRSETVKNYFPEFVLIYLHPFGENEIEQFVRKFIGQLDRRDDQLEKNFWAIYTNDSEFSEFVKTPLNLVLIICLLKENILQKMGWRWLEWAKAIKSPPPLWLRKYVNRLIIDYSHHFGKEKCDLKEIVIPPLADFKDPQNEVSLQDIWSSFNQFDRIVITGEAGSGKTTLLFYLALTPIYEFDDVASSLPLFPFYIQYTKLKGKNENVRDFLFSQLKNCGLKAEEVDSTFKSDLRNKKLLLLLDDINTVDEISQLSQEIDVEGFDQSYCLVFASARIINNIEISSSERFKVFQLRPLNPQHRDGLLSSYLHDNDEARKKLSRLIEDKDDEDIKELAENLFFLTRLCKVFKRYGNSLNNISLRKSIIYKELLQELWNKLKKSDFQKLEKLPESFIHVTEKIFSQIGYKLFIENRLQITLDELSEMIRSAIPEQNINLQSIIKNMIFFSGLLKPLEGGRYCFSYRAFYKYFTALYISKSANSIEIIEKIFEISQSPDDLILLIAGLIDPEDQEFQEQFLNLLKEKLIRTAVEGNRDINKFLEIAGNWGKEISHSTSPELILSYIYLVVYFSYIEKLKLDNEFVVKKRFSDILGMLEEISELMRFDPAYQLYHPSQIKSEFRHLKKMAQDWQSSNADKQFNFTRYRNEMLENYRLQNQNPVQLFDQFFAGNKFLESYLNYVLLYVKCLSLFPTWIAEKRSEIFL